MTEHEIALHVLRSFPERLRAHRYRLNLSLRDVSDVVGISDRNVAAIEHGHHTPSFATLVALLDWMARSAKDPPRPGEPRERVTERARAARKSREAAS